MRLQSGPARGDAIYFSGFVLLCLFMAGWFYRDYRWGYIEKNRIEARKQLTGPIQAAKQTMPATFGAKISKAEFDAAKASGKIEDIRRAFGEPLLRNESVPGEVLEIYVSDYGRAEVPLRNGAPVADKMTWTTWYKDREEVEGQLYWAMIPLALSLYAMLRLGRAVSLRAVIDDSGLTYGGKHIPFASMTRLTDYSKKGWVDLYYTTAAGEQKLRIDNQKIAKFDEIIDELCREKGFPDPRPQPETEPDEEPAA
jgi:hypothetical protein